MAEAQAAIHLDGSYGEGGGQILRTALFLSTLLQVPFSCDRIRAGRRDPGLKPQHLGILEILALTTGATVEGARVGSSAIQFRPGRPRGGEFEYDVGTAGSIPLLLQTLLPVAMLSPEPFRLRLRGGTDVTWGPTIEWVRHVLLPLLEPVTPGIEVRVADRGFYPRGGGDVVLSAAGHAAQDATELSRRIAAAWKGPRDRAGAVVSVNGVSVASEALQIREVADRQASAANGVLAEARWPEADVAVDYARTLSPGSSLTLWAVDEHGNRWGSDGLGARGTAAEDVGRGVAERLIEDVRTGATVDRNLADHLVPWIALGAPAVRVPMLTMHLTTNVWVCRTFLGPDCVELRDNRLAGRRDASSVTDDLARARP